ELAHAYAIANSQARPGAKAGPGGRAPRTAARSPAAPRRGMLGLHAITALASREDNGVRAVSALSADPGPVRPLPAGQDPVGPGRQVVQAVVERVAVRPAALGRQGHH